MNLDRLRAAAGYDPEGDTGIDSLIDYKDALEDAVSAAENTLNELLAEARKVMEADNARWEALAVGQDSEEAEASGVLIGQENGLLAALAVLRGEDGRASLDLYLEGSDDE